MMPVPQLPSDITDEIIAYLPLLDRRSDNTQPNSFAASLVCSAWLAPARRNIFHTIRLTTGPRVLVNSTRLLQLLDAIGSSEELSLYIKNIIWKIPESSFHVEEEFPQHALTRLSHLTSTYDIAHEFDVYTRPDNMNKLLSVMERAPDIAQHTNRVMWSFKDVEQDVKTELEDVLLLMQRFHAVNSVHIWQQPSRSHLQPILPHRLLSQAMPTKCITSLTISSVSFSCTKDFCAFVGAFGHLTAIHCEMVDVLGYEHIEDKELCTYTSPPPHLQEIMVHTPPEHTGSAILLRWLSVQTNQSHLRKVEMGSVHANWLTTYNIKSLSLKLRSPVDLQRFTCLTSLVFETTGPMGLRHMAATLDTVQSDVFVSVELITHFAANNDWDLLSTALQRLCFSRLSRLRFYFFPTNFIPSARKGLAALHHHRGFCISDTIRSHWRFV